MTAPAMRRADDGGQLERALEQGVGRRQALGLEGPGQERLLGGQVQGVGRAEDRAEEREQRQRGRPGEHEGGDRADDRAAHEVGRRASGPRRPAVGEDAERQEHAGRAARRSRSGPCPSASPDRVRSMTSHDRAMKWNWSPTTEIGLARPQQAEVAGGERAPGTAWSGRERVAALIRRRCARASPSSSSTSRIGPR